MTSTLSSSSPAAAINNQRSVVQPVQRDVPDRFNPALVHAGQVFVAGVAATGCTLVDAITADLLVLSAPASLAVASVVALAAALVAGIRRYLQSTDLAKRLQVENDASDLEHKILSATSDFHLKRLILDLKKYQSDFEAAQMLRRYTHLMIVANDRRAVIRPQTGRASTALTSEPATPRFLAQLDKARNDLQTCWFFNRTYYREQWHQRVYDVISTLTGRHLADQDLLSGIAQLKAWRSQDVRWEEVHEGEGKLILLSYTALFRADSETNSARTRSHRYEEASSSDSEGDVRFP